MDYIIHNGQLLNTDELMHYGVIGMKWGVRRAAHKQSRNEKLRKKALSYDVKSAKANKASEKAHAKYDLERSNKANVKAAKLDIKAAKLEKRANKADNGLAKSTLHARAEKAKYKAAKKRIDGNRLSKSVGYGSKAMKLSIKSDTFAKKAAKARMKMAKNERFIEIMNTRVADIK